MNPVPLPEEVVRFLTDRIDSVPQLEALLLLRETAPRAWTTAELAARVYVNLATASRLVQDLERHQLAAAAGADHYSYAAGAADAAIIDEVADLYGRHLVQVAQLIHSKTPPSLREFARAFQVKKGD